MADSLSLNRAPLLLVLFGAWLPFLTILALLSKRHKFPFIISFIAGGVIFSLFIGDGHGVRIAELSKEQQAALKPVAFAEALKDWKAASGWTAKGCEQFLAGAPELASCPRPILVAAEGGGSRAAFLLASLLGLLEDDSLDARINPGGRQFHQQLFAVSGVSGGSVGAAFFISALKAQPKQTAASLKKALYRQRLWFRNLAKPGDTTADGQENGGMKPGFLTDFVSYKDALQAALSNDFVSPVLTPYFARDVSLQQTFVDTYSKVGFAKLYDRKTPLTAADLLNDRVIPFFDEQGVKLQRMLTDRGTEYCGNPERHEYELYLAVEDIDHSRTKTKSPQTNGIVERFHKTVLNEFYRIAFRKKLYGSIEDLQTDLDQWLEQFNRERPHQGRWCFGKTPMQTFLDAKPIAEEKMIAA